MLPPLHQPLGQQRHPEDDHHRDDTDAAVETHQEGIVGPLGGHLLAAPRDGAGAAEGAREGHQADLLGRAGRHRDLDSDALPQSARGVDDGVHLQLRFLRRPPQVLAPRVLALIAVLRRHPCSRATAAQPLALLLPRQQLPELGPLPLPEEAVDGGREGLGESLLVAAPRLRAEVELQRHPGAGDAALPRPEVDGLQRLPRQGHGEPIAGLVGEELPVLRHPPPLRRAAVPVLHGP
mmetsp:Transcript_22566/g.59593  ORF Transcript_22566/g.59593 Transcript_22566/m.59593 type:complete len:236 (-) Transcript_22566:24-731(-)